MSRDTTDLMAAREQQRLLNGELSHRLKNVLALVQSVANQTFRQAETLADANAAFGLRLAALGKATDVLTAMAWQGGTLQDILAAGLTAVDGMHDRITIEGPAITLDPQVTLAFALALHELTTNACKYGALSNESGIISISWKYSSVENAPDGRFEFEWRESGGPIVTAPTRKGFGSQMIERSLRAYFRGDTVLDYDPTGLVFRVDAPLPQSALLAGE